MMNYLQWKKILRNIQDTVVVEPRETVVLPSQNQGEINFELLANNLVS